jgi:hypothetical protein
MHSQLVVGIGQLHLTYSCMYPHDLAPESHLVDPASSDELQFSPLIMTCLSAVPSVYDALRSKP